MQELCHVTDLHLPLIALSDTFTVQKSLEVAQIQQGFEVPLRRDIWYNGGSNYLIPC